MTSIGETGFGASWTATLFVLLMASAVGCSVEDVQLLAPDGGNEDVSMETDAGADTADASDNPDATTGDNPDANSCVEMLGSCAERACCEPLVCREAGGGAVECRE